MGYQSNQNTSVELNGKSQANAASFSLKLKEYDCTELRVIGEVGVGSFSIVMQCHHDKLGPVAVKIFGLTGSQNGIERKLNEAIEEAKKLSVIKHPNIIEVHGITRWRSHCAIIMEVIRGGNLEDLLFDSQIESPSWDLRLRLSLQIIKALQYLHSKSKESQTAKKPCMQHGDLKPQNILLTESANVKLCDFSASVVALATGITSSSRSCNFPNTKQYTPNYTPPEVVVNRKCHIKSDVYSFGLILFEIITRRRVFEGQNPDMILLLQKGPGVKPDVALVDQIGEKLEGRDLKIFIALKEIMTKCWRRDLKERSSAAQVLEELLSLMNSLNIGEADLKNVEIPKDFHKLISRRNSRTRKRSQQRLDELNVFAMNATYQLVEDDVEADSGEGAFLALKKGKLLKYNVASKTITQLEGKTDADYLNGMLVKNGCDIYIIDVKSELQTIKKLELNGNKWSSKVLDSRSGEKISHAASIIYKKCVFVVGGLQEKTRETVEIFDLVKRKWIRLRDMNLKRQGHMLVKAEDVLYAMGGYEMNSVESFELDELEVWNEIQPMTFERYGATAVLMNGKIYAIGGFDNRNNKLLSSVEVFDLRTKIWEQGGASLKMARCWHGACAIGRRIYVVGGETNVLESYDPVFGWEIECEDDMFKGIRSIVPL